MHTISSTHAPDRKSDTSDWSSYSTLLPEFETSRRQIEEICKVPTMQAVSDVLVLRPGWSQLIKLASANVDCPREGLIVKEVSVPVEDGASIAGRVYIPTRTGETPTTFPVVVNLHGGGYCLGDLDTDDLKCRTLCVNLGLVVFNVDYRLSPEFPWPTGLNDSFEATKWIVKNAAEFSGEISKGFILCGLSAGSLFAAVITQRACTHPALKGKITGQALQCPVTLGSGNGFKPEKYKAKLLSYDQVKDDPVLSSDNMKILLEAYKPGPDEHPDCSPLLDERLQGLPPTYFQVSGKDILRDEGLLYAQLLHDAGVPRKVDVYPGMPHGFSSIIPHSAASKKWDLDLEEGIRWLLTLVKTSAVSNSKY